MNLAVRLFCTALMAACSGGSQAQTRPQNTTIYRCGPEGRELRGSPCPADAKASTQTLQYDQPSAAQSAEARQRAAQEAKQAHAMEQARLKREAEQRREAARAGGIHGQRGGDSGPAQAASAPTPPKKPKKPKKPKAAKPG
ncbi:hypothetical protein [Paucibacter soli]|uniref:hypothetical protein n=1 Tax=Paucibacter soli TaxID=3133433 RepID=UPI0030B1E821